VIYGVIVTIAGLTDDDAAIDKAEGVNINLWTGLGMLALGVFFLLWLKVRPTAHPTPPLPTQEDRPSEQPTGTRPGALERAQTPGRAALSRAGTTRCVECPAPRLRGGLGRR
jgi:hypothetical protein